MRPPTLVIAAKIGANPLPRSFVKLAALARSDTTLCAPWDQAHAAFLENSVKVVVKRDPICN